jgi:broad specificity phosphatase PhoE
MVRFVLIRPGSTDFDEQGRIKGNLDIPLNAKGTSEAAQTAGELLDSAIDLVYTSPCQSAEQTAQAVGQRLGIKVKRLEGLANLDCGLWQGKRVEEVRQQQPKAYRMWQDHPEKVSPPEGESVSAAQARVKATLARLLRKHRSGNIAMVAPEPLLSLVACQLRQADLGDLWKVECACGSWHSIDVEGPTPVTSS